MVSVRQTVFETLNGMGIAYDVIEHPAVYTIEEMDRLNFDSENEVVKNLFIRDDKKKRYFIVVLQKDKTVNLKALREKLGCKPLSFASEDDLRAILGLTKGAVSPFGVLNDAACTAEVVLDKDILSFKRIGVHPNDNTATVFIRPEDLEAVIRKHGSHVSRLEI